LGCLLVFSLNFFFIYLLRRTEKEALYFSICCIIIALNLLVSGNYFILKLFSRFDYALTVQIYYICIYWGVFLFLLFITGFYPEKGSKKSYIRISL
jgi:hypothetical protein